MGVLPGIGGCLPPVLPFALTYIGANSLTTDLTTYSHGSFVAPSDGLMIVGVAGRSAANITVSSVSIGGTNGTIHINPSGSAFGTCLASRVVLAGSQAVSVTYSAASQQSSVFVWFLTGYISATPNATTGVNTAANSTGFAASLNVPANGVAIFVGIPEQTASTVTFSAATSRGQTAQESHRPFGADYTATAAETPHSETIGWTSNVDHGVSAASWR